MLRWSLSFSTRACCDTSGFAIITWNNPKNWRNPKHHPRDKRYATCPFLRVPDFPHSNFRLVLMGGWFSAPVPGTFANPGDCICGASDHNFIPVARLFLGVEEAWVNGCFLVPLIGGRWYIITQLAVYTTYILRTHPNYILMFPKIVGWKPPNHPLNNRGFHYFHHPFWGTPILWKHPVHEVNTTKTMLKFSRCWKSNVKRGNFF